MRVCVCTHVHKSVYTCFELEGSDEIEVGVTHFSEYVR